MSILVHTPAVFKSQKSYWNSGEPASATDTPSGIPNADMYLLGYNNNGSPLGRTPAQMSIFFAGSSLTEIEAMGILDAFETYMDSNSKGVISYGSDLMTGDTWTTGTGWSESSGVLTGTSTDSTCSYSFPSTPTNNVRIDFDCTVTGGSFAIRDSSLNSTSQITSTGSYSYIRNWDDGWVVVDGDAFTGTVSNIVILELTIA